MLSVHRGIVYPVDSDITDFDIGTDVEEYNYDGRLVFRGNLDTQYSNDQVRVYWLYDESKRVGLVEHRIEEHTCYWFRDNVYSTLFQEDWTCRDKTLWTIMSESAYEDCMRNGWTKISDLQARTSLSIVRPSDILNTVVPSKTCIRCGTMDGYTGCHMEKHEPRYDVFFTLFVDDDGVLYVPPSDTQAFATLRRPFAAGVDDAGAGDGAGAGAETVGVGAASDSASSSASASASSSSLSDSSAALAPPTTGGTDASASSSSSLNISRAV